MAKELIVGEKPEEPVKKKKKVQKKSTNHRRKNLPATKKDGSPLAPNCPNVYRNGRTPMYDDPNVMAKEIDRYFTKIEGTMVTNDDGSILLDKNNQPVMMGRKPATITGLCRFLGFTSREALQRYGEKEGFERVVEAARLRVAEYAEERLFDRDGVNGAKFTLENNFGWKGDNLSTGNIILVGALQDYAK